MPLYFQMRPIGDNVWFQPALVYFTALFLTALPVSEWALRLPSAIVGVIDVVLVYCIAKRLFGSGRPALLAAALLALTPAHFIHSRIAMDYLYPVPFVLGWLLCLMIFLERGNLRLLFLATSLLGLGLYSYIASLIMMPVYLALTGLALALTAKRPVQHYIVALAGFAWPIVFMAAWLGSHPGTVGDTLSRYGLGAESEPTRPITGLPVSEMLSELRRSARLSSLTGRVSLYWYFFDPSYLFVTGGYANVLNSTRHVGVFLIPLLVAVPVGLWRLAVTRKTAVTIIVLLGFATAPLAACLAVPEGYAIDRELELLPFTGTDCDFRHSAPVVGVMAPLAAARRRPAIGDPISFRLFHVRLFRRLSPAIGVLVRVEPSRRHRADSRARSDSAGAGDIPEHGPHPVPGSVLAVLSAQIRSSGPRAAVRLLRRADA